MGSNPINLAVRFILEVSALIIIGIWGWNQDTTWLKYLYAIGLPALMAAAWGTFAVPNDPSRSGKAPVPTAGWLRLILELSFFTLGTMAYLQLGYTTLGLINALVVALHYIVSYDRIIWMLKQ